MTRSISFVSSSDELIYDAHHLGIERRKDLVVIHIVAGDWRETPKKAPFMAIGDDLAEGPGSRPEDVNVALSPNGRDERSFANGVAFYVNDKTA